MSRIRYEEGRQAREHLRDTLRRRGRDDVDDVAESIQKRWSYGPLRSYRLALELSLEQTCKRVNALQETYPGTPGYLDHSTLSKLERWPASGRRPTVSQLVALAAVFGTLPPRLVAASDWDMFPAIDRLALRTFEQLSPAGAVATPPTMGMMEVNRPQAGGAPRVPRTPWAQLDPIRSGDTTEKEVIMSGEESAQYAEHGSNIAQMTLDQLRTELMIESRKFANSPRSHDLFGRVRLLRDRLFAYLDGGQPIRQRRDLYFLSGVSCGLLAVVSDDFGYPAAAMSHARAGHVFAVEAGDPALTGWLYTMQANICYWNAQPGKARDYARRGATLSPAGTVGVWLPSMEARACGELADAEGVRTAVRRAAEARETVQPGPLDEFGGQLRFSQPKQHFYATNAFLGIGDDQAVIAEASAAVDGYENGPTEDRAYDNMAIARFHAAIAHIRAGNLDAGSAAVHTALDIEADHHTAHVDTSARSLHRYLRAAGLRDARLAVETRDKIEEFLSITPARLELP